MQATLGRPSGYRENIAALERAVEEENAYNKKHRRRQVGAGREEESHRPRGEVTLNKYLREILDQREAEEAKATTPEGEPADQTSTSTAI